MGKMEKINNEIFYLLPQSQDGGAMAFITGKSNFLIDCGASDNSISELSSALKKIGYSLKNIDCVVFTHCHPENIGGAHRLIELAPWIRVMSFGAQADRLKNPTYYATRNYSLCQDYAPPFREVRGVFIDGRVSDESPVFRDLHPVPAPGHDVDCVCWYHAPTGTLICGDAVQGDGTDITGVAAFTDLHDYRDSLNEIRTLDLKYMLCGAGFRGVDPIIVGTEACHQALNYSYDRTEVYESYAEEYVKETKRKRLQFSLEDMVMDYFSDKKKPAYYGYSMITFRQYVKQYL